jgi:hypothetical protein
MNLADTNVLVSCLLDGCVVRQTNLIRKTGWIAWGLLMLVMQRSAKIHEQKDLNIEL